MSKFRIEHTCADTQKRPLVSARLREYFSRFLTDELLRPQNIIIGSKYDTVLSMIFSPETVNIELPNQQKFILGTPSIIANENVKLHIIFIPFNIQEHHEKVEAYLEVCKGAISFFFRKNFKKLVNYNFDELYSKMDLNYLKSIPYPAPFSEQRFLGDGSLGKIVQANYDSKTGMTYQETIVK